MVSQAMCQPSLPPDRGLHFMAGVSQVCRGAGVHVDDVQPTGEVTRVVLRAVPAQHRQWPAVGSLGEIHHVPPGEFCDDRELARFQVEQTQPVPAPVLAHRPLGPCHRVVVLGPAAFVVVGQLVAGHDGYKASADQGGHRRDLAAPAQHSDAFCHWSGWGDWEVSKLLIGDVEQPGRVRGPTRQPDRRAAVGQPGRSSRPPSGRRVRPPDQPPGRRRRSALRLGPPALGCVAHPGHSVPTCSRARLGYKRGGVQVGQGWVGLWAGCGGRALGYHGIRGIRVGGGGQGPFGMNALRILVGNLRK